MNTPEDHWEELDTTHGTGGYMTFYAVLDCEATSPTRLGLLRDKGEAERWADDRRKAAVEDDFETIYFTEFLAALPVRGLTGEFWNSYDPEPKEGTGWK